MLPPIGSPIAPIAMTFLRFGAKRCSLIAIVSESMSRATATVNGSSVTTFWSVPYRAALLSATLCSITAPGATETLAACVSSPV